MNTCHHQTRKVDRYWFFYFVLFAVTSITVSAKTSCYTDNPPDPYYSTETIYSEGKKLKNRNKPFSSENEIPGCTAVHLQLFVRHGTRYPAAKDIDRAIEVLYPLTKDITVNYNDGKTKMCGKDFKMLHDWKITYNQSKAKMLATRGEREIRDIADIYVTYFPFLLRPPYSKKQYEFLNTNTLRTKMSAKIFAMELFGHKESEKIAFKNTGKEDLLLRPYRSCPAWENSVLNNPSAHEEIEKFKQSKPFLRMVSAISERFGFSKPLPVDTIMLIHLICRFEYGVNQRSSPWCVALTKDDIKVFEHYFDLEYWWLHGYGNSINYQQSCQILKKIVENLQTASNTSNLKIPRAMFAFSHSKFMLRLFAILGLFKDDQLNADDFGKEHQWRLSAIDPVATNLGIALYKCSGKKHKVKVFAQERSLKLPHCSDVACDLDQFLEHYKNFTETCNSKDICHASVNSAVSPSVSSGTHLKMTGLLIAVLFISVVNFTP